MSQDKRVLSIQSHVVSGYVGNKSATFPLQVLGFEVDAINTVQFSNHSGYGVFKGQVITEQDFDELIDGLKQNCLLNYTHVLTGYCRSPQLLTKIGKLIQELKKINPNLLYVCDPVMGDNGHMYVPQEVLPVYINELLPLADVICPNQYEAELLTNIPTKDISSLLKTIDTLHDRGIKTVIISSSEHGLDNHLLGVASTTLGGSRATFSIDIPKVDAIFTGTGDLFASLFLAWFTLTEHNVKETLERTIATVQSVLERTSSSFSVKDSLAKLSSKERELKLIQSKCDIENPKVKIQAKPIIST
uniref:Pyridoxal kinase n=1 Tax=Cacopsylla melanoneura TaxID=428564 RepID=A0A8D8RGR0_9HEMI